MPSMKDIMDVRWSQLVTLCGDEDEAARVYKLWKDSDDESAFSDDLIKALHNYHALVVQYSAMAEE